MVLTEGERAWKKMEATKRLVLDHLLDSLNFELVKGHKKWKTRSVSSSSTLFFT